MGELRSLKKLVSSVYLTMSDEKGTTKSIEPINFGLAIETKKQLTTFENKIKNIAAAAQYVSCLLLIKFLTKLHEKIAVELFKKNFFIYSLHLFLFTL